MWPFKSKYDKLKREDVTDAICKLEQEQERIDHEIEGSKKQIATLMEKGKKETDKQIKLYYAKKINTIKANRERDIKRITYLMYNIQLLERLKTAIDDNQFFKTSSKISLNNLLADQKGLAVFLNKTLQTKISAEDVLTSADETFNDIESSYEENETIYGVSKNDDELLAMFETEEQVNSEEEIYAVEEKKKANSDNKGE